MNEAKQYPILEITSEWETLHRMIQAMIDVVAVIPRSVFEVRMRSVQLVDSRCRKNGVPWYSDWTRDNYYAMIIRGTVTVCST